MDTELARTFLAVVAEGTFFAASERLHLTQSTVSVRIRSLEETLNCRLFVRNKAGAVLTPAGRRFQKHARVLLQTVEQARHDAALGEGFPDTVEIGARIGLWDGFLDQWLSDVRRSSPDISFRTMIGFEEDLMPALVESRIDIGVMYTPQYRPGLEVDQLFEERLIMVTTNPDSRDEPDADHVLVDWGPEFYARFRAAFPSFAGSAVSVSVGWLGLRHLNLYGGSGYFPLRLIKSRIDRHELFAVPNAPQFKLPAYVVYSSNRTRDEIDELISNMHRMAVKQSLSSLHTLHT
ncbi:LysR family transcriptional regulator [Hyphococcus luteus]|uniref:LysR family transcriptional regulator n=1 Tax=Hyphococcus luteus TaxID=2058213 RepID=A0A2S7KB48_9PROT|nr:LysR family transcriptional regulator [Marinicaulis flavus]PQA89744.1 LysR family transcriptional regulator [Marinicaulis flavus]